MLPRNHAGAEVLGAWLAGLASSDRLPSPNPQLCFLYLEPSFILLADSIQKIKTKVKTTIITKRIKDIANQSSRWKHPLPQPAVQGQLLIGPTSPQDPGSAGLSRFPNWEVLHSICTLTHTGLTLVQRLGVVL